MKPVLLAITAVFAAGVVYGAYGGTIPAVAVMLISMSGATIFGIASVATH